ncbi:MAG: prolyl oligopeptidase family serine peptidase [Candidatus Omnitrophica bacterium]|nr:prolyl oligopeptidase family serine peptidase [Candidatus Omnitrophota bacterium]
MGAIEKHRCSRGVALRAKLCGGVALLLGVITLAFPSSCSAADKESWPPEVQEIQYLSQADQTEQPALYYDSGSDKEKPLLVALHTWSGNYKQSMSIPYFEWCIDKDWVCIHPNFRGPNKTPEAMGSELVVQDILSAVDYANENGKIDETRIYLVGVSGGGHASILMAGRAPEVWTAVSAWVPISDIERWHRECIEHGERYDQDIRDSVGGNPLNSQEARDECHKRSPIAYLSAAKGLPLDINAGIHDGHTGSVPVGQTLRAFNEVAEPKDQISEKWIENVERTEKIPEGSEFEGEDPLYGDKKVLFRKESGKARVTLFEGGHEIIYDAALKWLEGKSK